MKWKMTPRLRSYTVPRAQRGLYPERSVVCPPSAAECSYIQWVLVSASLDEQFEPSFAPRAESISIH